MSLSFIPFRVAYMRMRLHLALQAVRLMPLMFIVAGCHVADHPYQLQSTVLTPELRTAPVSRVEPSKIKIPKVIPNLPISVATIEFDKEGKVSPCQAPSPQECQIKRATDHISTARAALAGDPAKQLVVITYVHGWHHDASWYSYNFRNFQRMIDCLNWGATTYTKLYDTTSFVAPNPVSCTHEVADSNVLYAGVYIGWPGESIVGPTSVFSLPAEHTTAIAVAGGEVSATISRLIEAAKHGDHPARFVLIGHSFGGLIAGRITASSLLSAFTTPDKSISSNCGDGISAHHGSSDLVVLVNAFDNSVRPADLIRVMKDDEAASPSYFCKTSGATSVTDQIDRPIVLSLHTPSDSSTEDYGALALKWTHADDNYAHKSELNAMDFNTDSLEANPGFDMMKSKPINRLAALHNTCYLDQAQTGDDLCDHLNDLIYALKKRAYEQVMGKPLTIIPSLGKPDPYYHGTYELILSVCRNTNELAGDSEFAASPCTPELQVKRGELTREFVRILTPYFAAPVPLPGNRVTILLDLYKRIGLSCENGDWTRSHDAVICSGSNPWDLSHVKKHDIWNTTPYWFVNVSYEIIEKHSGFWNQDVFILITDLMNQSPVLPVNR